MVTFLKLKLGHGAAGGKNQMQGFKRWEVSRGSYHFKGAATKWRAIEWHGCGVSRMDAQGKSASSGVAVAVLTVHDGDDRIVI